MLIADEGDDSLQPERQILYHNDIELTLDHKNLEHYDIRALSTIYVGDAGYQIPMRIAKVMTYSVPIILFYFFSNGHEGMY